MNKEHSMLKVRQLQVQGLKQWQIVQELGVTKRTMRNYLREDIFPRRRRKRPGKLNTFWPFIETVLNAVLLHDHLATQGYTGKISMLRDLVREIL